MEHASPVKVIRRKRVEAASDIESGYAKSAETVRLKALDRIENAKKFKSRPDLLASDSICMFKWRFKQAAELFHNEPWMQCVDRYYPYAEGGPLLVDEPTMPHQEARCERKRETLRTLGYRYVVLKMGMSEQEDWLELERCGPHSPTP